MVRWGEIISICALPKHPDLQVRVAVLRDAILENTARVARHTDPRWDPPRSRVSLGADMRHGGTSVVSEKVCSLKGARRQAERVPCPSSRAVLTCMPSMA